MSKSKVSNQSIVEKKQYLVRRRNAPLATLSSH